MAVRYKTWEEECLPRMEIRGDGPVALCVLWNLLESVSKKLPEQMPDLGVIGNLRTPLGISWFLRGLYQFPHIQKVVIWGSDLTASAEALLSLWSKGVADGHVVPGYGWALDELVSVDAIDLLRKDVQLVDLRHWSFENVVGELELREGRTSVRKKQDFPPVIVPDRTFFPSRGTTVHIEAPDVAQGWLGAISAVMRCGTPRATRKAEKIAHIFDVIISFPIPQEETIHPCFEFTSKDLEKYATQVLSSVRPDGVDYWYGERIQNWRGHNQLEEVIGRLKEAPDTKRATMAILEAPDLEELEDAPCFALATFSVREEKLDGSFVFRSHDMYSGWPFNIFAILRLHRLIANRLEYGYGRATFHSQNAQIYERSWDRALQKLRDFGPSLDRPAEFLKFVPDLAGDFVFTLTKEKIVKCTYMNPKHDQIIFEAEHRNPRTLISWVVANMPWLSPQHIRHLGVEEEKLRRALNQGEEYIQG